ncbi:hypothetical protein BH10ACT2_BH10ACT2_19640 [soil metagenome]
MRAGEAQPNSGVVVPLHSNKPHETKSDQALRQRHASNEVALPTGWMAHFRFEVDSETALHPTLQDIADEMLAGHVPITELYAGGLAVTCAIYDEVSGEAAQTADRLVSELCKQLGLPAACVFGPILNRYQPIDEYFSPIAPVAGIGGPTEKFARSHH